jgi:hypothetical protein
MYAIWQQIAFGVKNLLWLRQNNIALSRRYVFALNAYMAEKIFFIGHAGNELNALIWVAHGTHI